MIRLGLCLSKVRKLDFFFQDSHTRSQTYGSNRSLTSWWPQGSTSPGAFLERQKVTFTQGRGPRVSDAREAYADQTNSKIHSFLNTYKGFSSEGNSMSTPIQSDTLQLFLFERCRWPTGMSWLKSIPRVISHLSEEAGSSILHRQQLLGEKKEEKA